MTTALVAGALFLTLQGVFLWMWSRKATHATPPEHPLEARVIVLEEAVRRLPQIWSEDVQRANRHRARAEQAERRARQIAEEGSGDVDVEGIPEGNGAGSAVGGVPAVRADVGSSQPAPALSELHNSLIARRLDPYNRLGK